jgi:hypothetical protein
MTDFVTIYCRTCGGVAHPASGCAYSPTFVVCGPCVRDFWSWVQRHTNSKGRRKGGPNFYDHVGRIASKVTT